MTIIYPANTDQNKAVGSNFRKSRKQKPYKRLKGSFHNSINDYRKTNKTIINRYNLIKANERKLVLLYIEVLCITMNIKITDCNKHHCFMSY